VAHRISVFNMLFFNIQEFITALMSFLSLLAPAGQIGILVYLYRNGNAHGLDIKCEMYVHPKTAASALSNLIKLKLVRELKNDNYGLTKKGKIIAEHLAQVEDLILE
jgi:predicted transcriptional regulator